MKISYCGISWVVLIFTILMTCAPVTAKSEVNVDINIGPPPIVVAAPAEVVRIPQSGIYFVVGINFDIFYYNGYWWSPRGAHWYRSRQYDGPWGVVQRKYVPTRIYEVPKNYRDVYRKERPINYGQWKKQRGNDEDRGHGDMQRRENDGRGQWEKQNDKDQNRGHGEKPHGKKESRGD